MALRALLLGLPVLGALAAREEAVVETPLGALRGLVRPSSRVFLGVPYGDAGRWARPVPVLPWQGVRDATTDPPGCLQDCNEPPFVCPATSTEACLFLNVWTPREGRGESPPSPLPVLVFLHGGRFTDGFAGGLSTGLIYEGTNLVNGSAYGGGGLILVALNYRLGVAGWLYNAGGGGTLEGNYGLMDQELALRWVQQNVAAFGGDPSRVTLVGQSAGGMSVAAHLVRPGGGAGQLFHRAILHSEPFSLPLRDVESSTALTRAFAGYANCTGWEGGWAPVEACMRGLTSSQLLDAQRKVETDVFTDIQHPLQVFTPFTPTTSTPFLPQPPFLSFQKGEVADIPTLLGFTRSESDLFVYAFLTAPLSTTEWYVAVGVLFGVGNVAPLASQYLTDGHQQQRPVLRVATGGDRAPAALRGVASASEDSRPALARLGSDALFICPIRNASSGVQVGGRSSPLWLFRYDHVLSFAPSMWGDKYRQCAHAACHGSDLAQLFHPNQADKGTTYTGDEDALSAVMQGYWAEFAETGDPNARRQTHTPPRPMWPPFSAPDRALLVLETGGGGVRVENSSAAADCAVWDDRVGYAY